VVQLLNQDQRNPDKEKENIPNIQQLAVMENEKSLEAKVEEWVRHISLSRKELGGHAICPFAKTATYKIVTCSIDSIKPVERYDVIIYHINESHLDQIRSWCDFYNEKYPDWLFFEDCASYNTFINDVKTNNGYYNFILGQPKDKLMKFRELLKKSDYYSYWSKEYYDEIVGQ
jgi:hypothetical protein